MHTHFHHSIYSGKWRNVATNFKCDGSFRIYGHVRTSAFIRWLVELERMRKVRNFPRTNFHSNQYVYSNCYLYEFGRMSEYADIHRDH